MATDSYYFNLGPGGWATMDFYGYASNIHYVSGGGVLQGAIYATAQLHPNTGYKIRTFTVNGISAFDIGGSDATTFNIGYPVNTGIVYNIIAQFELIAGSTITASAVNGSISPSGLVSVPYRTAQTFNFSANEGYVFYELVKNGNSLGNNGIGYSTFNGSYYFAYSSALNQSLQIIFGTAYGEIDVIVGANGVVNNGLVNIGPIQTVQLKTGTSILFTATPNAGYIISSVKIDGNLHTKFIGKSGSVPLEITPLGMGICTFELNVMTSVKPDLYHKTLEVLFSKGTYSIYASSGANGTISPLGTTSVALYASKTYTITPSSGYSVASLLIDGVAVNPTTSYTFSDVSADHTIYTTFANTTRYITASAGTGGTISPSGNIFVTVLGSSKTFTFTPNTGYSVSNVLVDRVSVGAVSSYTFSSITTDHTISVSFSDSAKYITASAGANGSISPAGSIGVTLGSSKTFTITANAGYQIDIVQVDGVSVGSVSTYTFSNITISHTIVASFKIFDSYIITASAGANGSISPAGNVAATKGTNKTFTITPNENCIISDVLIDGVSAGAVSTYTFTNVQAEHSIAAVFGKITYTIISAAGANGTITPLGTTTLEYGDDQAFVVTPDEDYVIQDIIVDGVSMDMPSSGILFIND